MVLLLLPQSALPASELSTSCKSQQSSSKLSKSCSLLAHPERTQRVYCCGHPLFSTRPTIIFSSHPKGCAPLQRQEPEADLAMGEIVLTWIKCTIYQGKESYSAQRCPNPNPRCADADHCLQDLYEYRVLSSARKAKPKHPMKAMMHPARHISPDITCGARYTTSTSHASGNT